MKEVRSAKMRRRILDGLKIVSVFLAAVCLGKGLLFAQGRIAIKGGQFYTITRGIVVDGVLLIENGKIKDIGANVDIPPGYQTILAKNKFILPGMIVGFSQVGLAGDFIASDSLESSEALTPQMRAIDGFYPLSKSIARLRARGITAAAVFPAPGNVISGQGAILKMTGSMTGQAVVNPSCGLLLTLGEKSKRENAMPKTRMGEMYLLKDILLDAQKYMEKKDALDKTGDGSQGPTQDFRLDPLVSLIKGKLTGFVYCEKVQDIMNALSLSDAYGFKLVLVDAQEASRVSNELARRNIPVLVVPQKSQWWDIEKTIWDPGNATKLFKAGVPIAIIPGEGARFGDEELVLYAAYAVRYGLPEEEALKAITIYPARVLGLESRLGSLEKGKDADIVIMDGPPFRIQTKVEKVLIDGNVFDPMQNQ
jgi:imidazolonepropionase-like amidohydrolase